MLFSILVFILLITIIVAIHEYGHLYYAKKYGVYCPEFSVGLGPVLFKKKYKGTVYKIRLLPLGGFVNICDYTEIKDFFIKENFYFLYFNKEGNIFKISDKNDKKLNISNDYIQAKLNDICIKKDYIQVNYEIDNCLKTQKVDSICFLMDKQKINITCKKKNFSFLDDNKKIKILFAGVLFNFILGSFCIFSSIFITGAFKEPIVLNEPSFSGTYLLKKDDKIIAINGQKIDSVSQIKDIVEKTHDNCVSLTIQDTTGNIIHMEKEIFYQQAKIIDFSGIKVKNIPTLGINFQRSHDFLAIIKEAIYKIYTLLKDTFVVLFCLFTGKIPINELTGLIGIANHTQDILKTGYQSNNIKYIFSNILYFLGFLSINTGAMNLLPIPILDGGRIVLIFLEKILGRKIDSKTINILINLSLLFILFIFIYVSYFDILRIRN